MKYIKFYGYDLNRDCKKIQETFDAIKKEIEYHKFSTGKYPEFIHVYESWLAMAHSQHPKNHLVISI